MTHTYPVDDPSRVAEIRRAAGKIAKEEGLDETLGGNVGLIVTEICTNLLKHAKGGEVFLSPLSDRSGPGVEILAVDRGPGMADVDRCLADGYSTVNTSGNGLGAIARLSHEFDVYSQGGKGTVLVARVSRNNSRFTSVGAVLKPIAGEELSGDSWAFWERKDAIALIVADGLGHGAMAARASAEAISVFRESNDYLPAVVLGKVHGALRSTRGAAVAVAYVDRAEGVVRYSGIGNIAGVLLGGAKPALMVSHNGTAGYHSPRIQEFLYPLPNGGLIIMHSDGLYTNWILDNYPGLRRRDPSVIAGILYRDASRNRDDVCVVVAKPGELL